VNIGILGLGTVGGGVVNVLSKNENEIFARTGEQSTLFTLQLSTSLSLEFVQMVTLILPKTPLKLLIIQK